MNDCLRAGKPSRQIINHRGQVKSVQPSIPPG